MSSQYRIDVRRKAIAKKRERMLCYESPLYSSIFLLFPFGAGSSGAVGSTGVREYVTVLVTTCLILTARVPPFLPSRSHSRGEIVALYGECTDRALMGDPTPAGE